MGKINPNKDKEKIIHIVKMWLERSRLTIKDVVARMQLRGCDLSENQFKDRFTTRVDKAPNIEPECIIALVHSFREGLVTENQCLAQEAIELATYSGLNLHRFNELRPFFSAEEFDEAIQQVANIPLSQTATQDSFTPDIYLPKDYLKFFGRKAELKELSEQILGQNTAPIISIIGLGGIGKTALARELVDQVRVSNSFDGIVWSSAKSEVFQGTTIIDTGVKDYNFPTLLEAIVEQGGDQSVPTDELKLVAQRILNEKKLLVVMDNLETAGSYNNLVLKMGEIIGQSKLLITSREKVDHHLAYPLKLEGLSEEDSYHFLKNDGQSRNAQAIVQATKEELQRICKVIYKVTHGAPLAMKLIVSQMIDPLWPLEKVLQDLEQAKFGGPNEQFYQFLYLRIWKQLGEKARELLIILAQFPEGHSVDYVMRYSKSSKYFNEEIFKKSLNELKRMSLIERPEPQTIALHSLTRYFVKSDITQEWKKRSNSPWPQFILSLLSKMSRYYP